MTTGMITTNGGGGMTVYDRVADPLAFIEQMGKVFAHSGACGCKTESEGKLLALACLCERQSPFDIQRRYHLMDGKLSMKADVMLAEFRNRGGKHEWVKDGSDGQSAELKLTAPDGVTLTSKFSLAEAQRAGIARDGSGWTKNPGNMLRARCSSNGVRMLMPEIVSGTYTPEEMEDVRSENVATAAPSRTAAEVKSRREELQAMQTEAAPFAASRAEGAGEVVDAEVVETSTDIAKELATTDDAADWTALLDVQSLLKQIGMTEEQLGDQIRVKDPTFTTLDTLPEDRLMTMAANIRKKIADSSKN